MRFQDIPQFSRPGYSVDIPLDYLADYLDRLQNRDGYNLDLDPPFQRGLVWSDDQQSRYVEFLLRGGNSSREILLNCPGWMYNNRGPFELVDGKQRIHACLGFMDNRVRAFGRLFQDFTGFLPHVHLRFAINSLETRQEVLQWYLDINFSGTAHTDEEYRKVQDMRDAESKKVLDTAKRDG